MGIFGGKDLLTASAHRSALDTNEVFFPFTLRNMWRTLTLLLVVGLTMGTEVSQYEDIVLVGAEETMATEQQEDFSGTPGSPTKSRKEILAAQFECYLKIIAEPPRTDAGSYCNRTWDGWLCWGDSAPGTVMQQCPGYFSDFDPSEKVTKVCDPDGQWFHHPVSKRVWSNYTLCTASTKERRKLALGLYYMAMVGHSLSIVSLLISLIIFSYFKSLSCQRVSVHKNTFLSFILNSIVTMIWLCLSATNEQIMKTINPVSCKMLTLLNQYTTISNSFWMLCEGIYLHTLIIVAVFVGEQQLFWYYVLGWGFPVVPAITYGMARWHFFNDNCWVDSSTHLLYIIHGPISAALVVNFFFLLNIVRVLITKLKKTHCAEATAYMKAVRAILILIPLLGIQYVILFWTPEGGVSNTVRIFLIHIFSHFQGLMVAIIFCFCNSEAQTAVKRKWAQWRSNCGIFGWGEQPMVSNHFSYQSSSLTETSRATISLELPSATGCLPSPQKDNSIVLAKVTPTGNGQQKRGKSCSNGEVDARKMDTTVI